MAVTDNVFVRRTLDDILAVEREMICVYAESCFLNIQILQGNLSCMDRLDYLMAELSRAERQRELLRGALRRIRVPCSSGCHLDENECLDLFEAHFTASDVAPLPVKGIFRRSDFRDMLSDIYESPGRVPASGY